MLATSACGLCDGPTTPFFEVEDIPVLSCALWSDEAAARGCVKRDIRLSFCPACGFIANDIFDPKATDYSEIYENAQHFSATYRNYAKAEAEGIVERFGLRNKTVVDIGSGDGYFLSLLAELGDNRGLGFDPSYSTEKDVHGERHKNVEIVSEYYGGEKHRNLDVDLVISRHVLEHIPNPKTFMESLRTAIGDRTQINICFEVPSAGYVLEDLSIWDQVYEHCTSFTPPALRRLFYDAGFTVNEIRVTYNRTCLAIEASAKAPTTAPDDSEELAKIAHQVEVFGARAKQRIEDCRAELKRLAAEKKRVALWGTGARAVMYLTMLGKDATKVVKCAVDINARKHGHFLPVTAQQIVAPERLPEFNPDVVLIMNPVYLEEITASVKELGVDAEVRVI